MGSDVRSAETEKELYPLVRRWLQREGYYCGDEQVKPDGSPRPWEDVGLRSTRLDVVGLKSIGGRFYDELEMVGVEVKKASKATVSHINQTLGYHRFVDRAYFAKPGDYRPELVQEAVRFGIGLLTIDTTSKKRPIRVVLSAGMNRPHPEQRAELMKRLWVTQCRLCGVFHGRYDTVDGSKAPTYVELRRTSMYRGDLEPEKPNYRPTLCNGCAPLLGFTATPVKGGFKWTPPKSG